MNIDSFYNELHEYKKQCLIINDRAINPIEIIVIVKNKKELCRYLNRTKNWSIYERILVGKRIVRIYSLRELGIDKCLEVLIKRGVEIKSNVHKLCMEDTVSILMTFISFSFFHNCFLKEHYIQVVHQFIIDNGYDGMSYQSFFTKSFHNKMKNRMLTVWVEKLRRKLFLYLLEIDVAKQIKTQGDYIDKIYKEEIITPKGKQIEQPEGRSNSVFFEDDWNGNHVFIKAGGYLKYRGTENEIGAHKVLKDCKENWFLKAYDYDEDNRLIAYPFIQEITLDKLVVKRQLNSSELRILYEFLMNSLDGLFQNGVLHNDFRFENIIAILNEQKELSSCKLYDFGCASTNGVYPWDMKSFISRELGMMVSGNYRYSSDYMDDAASAYLVFLHAGGDAQSDEAKELYSRIGRQFAYTNYGILDHIIVI